MDWPSVDLAYHNDASYVDSKRLTMKDTGRTYTATEETLGNTTTLLAGEWKIFSLELTVEQMVEIQSSMYVAFIKTGSYIKTRFADYSNILKASKVEYSPNYGLRTSIDSLDGYTFVIQGAEAGGYEGDRYLGSWVAPDVLG
jgi:hypothetical protein